nr:Symplekin like [Ipomoea batatas]GME21007.1 Symplekin like [Ipomoea batatas]
MAGPLLREQVLPLLAAANNHGDLDVKLSSLRQVKDVLLSADASQAAEIFPYLIDLQSSPETMLRKYLIQVIEDIAAKSMEHALMLMPVLLASLRDNSSLVVKQSIVSGTSIFYGVVEELSMQFHRRGLIERWLEEFWTWMIKFKDAIFGILFEAGPVGVRLLAIKFLEIYVLLFTPDATDSERYTSEAPTKFRRAFNISWIIGHHPIMDPAALISDANRTIGILLELLRSASSVPGSLTISVVNSLATIAKKRPAHYNFILSALLDFDPNFEMTKGGHTASIQYSLRTAFLGFLRCTHPAILESREKLQKALRAMNAGDAADQVLRQLDKMMRNNERASREARMNKDDQPSNHLPVSGDATKKRATPSDNEDSSINHDLSAKRVRYVPNNHVVPPVERNDSGKDYVNGVPQKAPVAVNAPNLVEQMISMIGALISEGERGVESLEILIAKIPPDVMADIVITNMRHLPRNPPSFTKFDTQPLTQQSDFSSAPLNGVVPIGSSVSKQTVALTSQLPVSVSNAVNSSISEMSTSLPPDSKRDPRRDPRRLDPRRVTVGIGVPPPPIIEDNINPMQPVVQSEVDASNTFNRPLMVPILPTSENMPVSQNPKIEADNTLESLDSALADWSAPKEEIQVEEAERSVPDTEENATADITFSSAGKLEQDSMAQMPSNVLMIDEVYSPSSVETDQRSPPISNTIASEDMCDYLPSVPPYIELTEEQQRSVETLAIEQIIDSYKRLKGADNKQTGMAMLSCLIAQINAGADVAVMVQKHILSDYQQQKGHEVVMHVLYHLRTLMLSDSDESSSSAASLYDKVLLGVAKFLLDTLPATDKSFSRLLSEVPYLPESAMRLLVDLCSENYSGKDGRDGDRVTQGLGAVWGLILGRPPNRQACLDIALKCAVHSKEDVRAKAIRLVTNKLYVLSHTSENIEQFAMNTFLSAVDNRVSGPEDSISGATNQRKEVEVGSQETSVSGSQSSDTGISENDSLRGSQFDSQSDSALSSAQAQRLVSLFFALCTKKPSLLQHVFDNYGRAPKAVKQAIHRHMPILIRAIGSSNPELLHIISDPPQGCENLLTLVITILSEGTTPPPDLIAVVKRLYETKLKDASILIPMLSSFSKSEVLPIFPRLVSLPLDKFQIAMARILQGSAHTGPALSPAEVLVAIHDINPERDGLPLKKITDACSACFEQRTVFTQQVLAKALNQMVDQTPLPLLFMRTVIQAIDAFPTLVDFVMEILSKLVNRQVWKMPKLWVGFLKCVSQTQPHSFPVLLQLPPPQLEGALNKYAGLRGPLAAFASQPNIKNSLPRPTLAVLGLLESNLQQPHISPSLHPSEASPSVHGATLT